MTRVYYWLVWKINLAIILCCIPLAFALIWIERALEDTSARRRNSLRGPDEYFGQFK